jgi:hypothetical protein
MKINNQEIYIFDNVYESHHTQKFYDFIIKSYFMIDLNDSNTSDYHNEKSFGAKYSMDDISNMGIVKYLPNNIKEKLNGVFYIMQI